MSKKNKGNPPPKFDPSHRGSFEEFKEKYILRSPLAPRGTSILPGYILIGLVKGYEELRDKLEEYRRKEDEEQLAGEWKPPIEEDDPPYNSDMPPGRPPSWMGEEAMQEWVEQEIAAGRDPSSAIDDWNEHAEENGVRRYPFKEEPSGRES